MKYRTRTYTTDAQKALMGALEEGLAPPGSEHFVPRLNPPPVSDVHSVERIGAKQSRGAPKEVMRLAR